MCGEARRRVRAGCGKQSSKGWRPGAADGQKEGEMYLHQELRLVADYRQTEALKRIHWLHSLMSLQPGFVRTLACRNPGRIDHYLWLRFWTSPEGNTDFRKTEEARQFAASRPEGMLYEPLPGGIAGEGHWHS